MSKNLPKRFRPHMQQGLDGKFLKGSFGARGVMDSAFFIKTQDMKPGDLVQMNGIRGIVQKVDRYKEGEHDKVDVHVRHQMNPAKRDIFEIREGGSLAGVRPLKTKK